MSTGEGPTARFLKVFSGGRRLHAALHHPATPARGAVVIAHPHPGHGGHMDHPVVVAAADRAVAAGLVAVRFDFRGVRQSEGSLHDIEGHLEDVRRVAERARAEAEDQPLLGAGFSYGARLLAKAVGPKTTDAPPIGGLLLLAPATKVPTSARDFGNLLLGRPLDEATTDAPAVEALGSVPPPVTVLVGQRDVVAPPPALEAALPPHARLRVLPHLNHFFSRGRGSGEVDEGSLRPELDAAYAWLIGDCLPG